MRSLLRGANVLKQEGDETLAVAVGRYATKLSRLEKQRDQIKRAIVAQLQLQQHTKN